MQIHSQVVWLANLDDDDGAKLLREVKKQTIFSMWTFKVLPKCSKKLVFLLINAFNPSYNFMIHKNFKMNKW